MARITPENQQFFPFFRWNKKHIAILARPKGKKR